MRNVFISLPLLASDRYQQELAEHVAAVRSAGLPLCLQIDWHVLNPYHGPPPHLEDLEQNRDPKPHGYGYAPFARSKLWIWAQGHVEKLLLAFRPDAVLWGQDPHIRVGWGFATRPEYHYNDIMGILRQALEETRFALDTLIIPGTPGSPIQAKGIAKARQLNLATYILPEEAVRWSVEDDMVDLEDEEDEDEDEDFDEGDPVEPDPFVPPAENEDLQYVQHPAQEHVEKAMYWLDMAWGIGPSRPPSLTHLRRARRQINRAIRLLRR